MFKTGDVFKPARTGFQGLICEMSPTTRNPEYIPVEDCLNCALQGAPCRMGSPAVLHGIATNMRPPGYATQVAIEEAIRQDGDNHGVSMGVSATELLGCQRRYHLDQVYPWWDKPSNLFWAFRGQAIHDAVEAWLKVDPYAVGEIRLFSNRRIGPYLISVHGAPDLVRYNPIQQGWHLLDYKTTDYIGKKVRHICSHTGKLIGDWQWSMESKSSLTCHWCKTRHPIDEIEITRGIEFSARSSHIQQLNIYADLVENNSRVLADLVNAQLQAKGFDPIVPPDAPVVGAELHYLNMRLLHREAVEIWPSDERIRFIMDRLAGAVAAQTPPILTNPLETWECSYCPHAEVCAQLHGGPVGKKYLDAELKAAEAAREAQAEADLQAAEAGKKPAFDPVQNMREMGF